MEYSPLFEAVDFKKIKLKNKLVMAPMTTISGNEDGSISSQEIEYLSQRAEDGIGLIMSPAAFCHKSGHAFENQMGCHNDKMLLSMEKCAEAINRFGSASFLQIHHGGNAAKKEFSGTVPLAPSAVKNRRGTSELPQAMTNDEIWMLIESFARSAGRAKKTGFTGIEVHGANTYLFQQFFSPFSNRREDKWGGDNVDPSENELSNRARFAVEVLKAIRSEVGGDYPISYRISPEEEDPLGYSTDNTIDLLKILVPHGIDIIHVSSWEYNSSLRKDIPEGMNPTGMIKKAFPDHPVIGVGGVMLPEQAMNILDDGVDLAALGKVLILNHDWVQKVKGNQIDLIKTALKSEDEREALMIPDKMKEYTRHFFVV